MINQLNSKKASLLLALAAAVVLSLFGHPTSGFIGFLFRFVATWCVAIFGVYPWLASTHNETRARSTITLCAASIYGACASTSSAQSDSEVKTDVDRIFASAEEMVSKNFEAFLKANEAPLAQARDDMAELIARLNKDGRGQLATLMQKRLNSLEETIQKSATNKVPIVAPPQKSLRDQVRGKWKRDANSDYLFKEDDTIEHLLKKEGRVYATATCRFLNDGTGEVLWPSGVRWRFRVIGNEWLAVQESQNGKPAGDGLVLERTK